jgi:ABC-2 type transport system ATP-binding protein
MSDVPAIKADGLVKHYGKTKALDGLDLTVPAGTVYGLLGPNGAGKTTAVRILATLLRPDGGQARVLGRDVVADAPAVRRTIGLTGQYAALDEYLSGRANLIMIGQLSRLTARAAKARADGLLEQFDLTAAASRAVKTYSGGMRRRLDLAASLIGRPAVLFLDEPTAGLDPQSRLALWEILGELNGAGQTILLTTHYMEEAEQLCDRVAIMDHGKILALDTPAALKQSIGADTIVTVKADGDTRALAERLTEQIDGVTNTRLIDGGVELHVTGPERLVPRVVNAAESGGFDLVDLSIAEPSLETVFISLTGKELRD